MTIRGGGNPHTAMATMPLGEWTRRLGALPAEAYDCFMVGTLCGFNRIQAWFARDCSWPMAGSPRIISWQITRSRAACRSSRGKSPDHGQPAAVLALVKDKPSAALKKRRP